MTNEGHEAGKNDILVSFVEISRQSIHSRRSVVVHFGKGIPTFII